MQILTAEEAAGVLRLHVQIVRKHLREGRLPGRKIGKGWRIVAEDLANYLSPNGAVSRERKLIPAAALGMFADVPLSTADLEREHREEVERDEQRFSEHFDS